MLVDLALYQVKGLYRGDLPLTQALYLSEKEVLGALGKFGLKMSDSAWKRPACCAARSDDSYKHFAFSIHCIETAWKVPFSQCWISS